jgi:hypothetical protein
MAEKAPLLFHTVRFYESEASLVQTVADFIGDEGLSLSEPAIIVARPGHRKAILSELHSRGVDVNGAIAVGDLVVLDAEETIATLMAGGMLDETLFTTLVPPVLDRLLRGRTCAIRAYGEMVDVLWQAGMPGAAIRLEALWNQLARSYDIWILCGYAASTVRTERGVREICAQHSHVIGRATSPVRTSS